MTFPFNPIRYSTIPLPSRCDIVIIGATIASLYLAQRLKIHGVSVLIIDEAPYLGAQHFLRGMGLGQLGLTDNIWRLKNSLGAQEAQKFLLFSEKSLNIAHQNSLIEHVGGYHFAYNPKEKEELRESFLLLHSWGIAASWFEPEELSFSSKHSFLGALYIHRECTSNPPVLFQRLIDLNQACNIPISLHTQIHEIEELSFGTTIHYDSSAVQTDLIVYAHSMQLKKWEPFFTDRQTTIRTQSIALKRSTPFRCESFSTQYGYIYWRDWEDMHLIGGCRWASPHLETGESDETIIHPKIEAALLKTAQNIFTHIEPKILFSWSRIELHSCDGLPIVGALPGSGDRLAMTSLLGRDIGLGFACAEAIYETIIEGKCDFLPPCIQPRRLI